MQQLAPSSSISLTFFFLSPLLAGAWQFLTPSFLQLLSLPSASQNYGSGTTKISPYTSWSDPSDSCTLSGKCYHPFIFSSSIFYLQFFWEKYECVFFDARTFILCASLKVAVLQLGWNFLLFLRKHYIPCGYPFSTATSRRLNPPSSEQRKKKLNRKHESAHPGG